MCTVCGCGKDNTPGEAHQHSQQGHRHAHSHGNAHTHHYGQGPAGVHAPGLSQARIVEIEQNILFKNDEYAAANRRLLQDAGILALNLVSSPGSGKTTLLANTVENLKADFELSVIEGDQQTENDAERIRETGVRALQINTGKGCHLDGHMIGHALQTLQPGRHSILFIENVGNLVCPAAFDLGEAHKVVVLSVTEGQDKPIKYPDMFSAADLILLNKIDLLPYVDFDVDVCREYARRVNPHIQVIEVSATKGDGMHLWYQWIRSAHATGSAGE